MVSALSKNVNAELSSHGYDAWQKEGQGLAFLANTTSAGMKTTPSLDLPLAGLAEGAAVFDAVYTPLETGLLKRAKVRGLETIDGLGMLMHQAVPSFEAFFDVQPHVDALLRSDLEKVLNARG